MKNVRIIDKGETPPFQSKDVWARSSDVVTYNLYEQSWSDLQQEGLSYLFNDNKAEFERRKEHNNEVIQRSAING